MAFTDIKSKVATLESDLYLRENYSNFIINYYSETCDKISTI